MKPRFESSTRLKLIPLGIDSYYQRAVPGYRTINALRRQKNVRNVNAQYRASVRDWRLINDDRHIRIARPEMLQHNNGIGF